MCVASARNAFVSHLYPVNQSGLKKKAGVGMGVQQKGRRQAKQSHGSVGHMSSEWQFTRLKQLTWCLFWCPFLGANRNGPPVRDSTWAFGASRMGASQTAKLWFSLGVGTSFGQGWSHSGEGCSVQTKPSIHLPKMGSVPFVLFLNSSKTPHRCCCASRMNASDEQLKKANTEKKAVSQVPHGVFLQHRPNHGEPPNWRFGLVVWMWILLVFGNSGRHAGTPPNQAPNHEFEEAEHKARKAQKQKHTCAVPNKL